MGLKQFLITGLCCIGLSLLPSLLPSSLSASVYSQSTDCYSAKIFLPDVHAHQKTSVIDQREQEPNDSSGQATGPLRPDITYYGHPNDQQDFYYFEMQLSGQISISLGNLSGSGKKRLQLYYESIDNLVAFDATEQFEIMRSDQPAGRYLILVYVELEHNSTTNYTLRVNYPLSLPTQTPVTSTPITLPECTPTVTSTNTPIPAPTNTSFATHTPTTTPTPTPTPTITVEGQSPSYEIADFYIPTGWMLNGENPAKFVFDDGYSGNCHSNTICYKISWQPERASWIGLYWLHPKADAAGGSWPQLGQPGCNLSGATTVTFWARGEKGGEVVKFESAFYANQKVESEVLTLTSNWQEYSMNVSGADLSNIVGAFAWYMSRAANPNETIFYLDDIRYQGIESGNVTCTQPTTATPTPKPTSQYGYNFESDTENWTTSEGEFKPITLTTTTQFVYSGVRAFQIEPNLRSDSSEVYRHTETVAYFNSAIPEGFVVPGPYNLTGKSVSCFVYLPSELAPGGNPQAYIQLFVKDKNFRNHFNTALDIVPANVNKWLQLNLTVGQGDGMDNGFDSQQSNALGISIKLHNQATLNYAGQLYIDHCTIPQP